MPNATYAFPIKQLDSTRDDGETIVHFSWDPIACCWIVTILGESVPMAYAARLIAAAGAALVPPPQLIEDEPEEDSPSP
jgi:hypothetical protein